MVVQHFPDACDGTQPCCAIVTRVGMETIDCSIVHPALGTLMPFSGVHHLDYQSDRVGSDGFWRPLAMQVAILKFLIKTVALVWDGESLYRTPAQPAVVVEPPKVDELAK